MTDPEQPTPHIDDEAYFQDGPGLPSVPVPNSIPTGSRFGTSTESYAIGVPNLYPTPTWVAEAVEMARVRRQARYNTAISPEGVT
jgi:hypothetical protein